MSKNLTEATQFYDCQRDELTGAYPISTIDAKIIGEVIKIAKKVDKELHAILKEYKNTHDADILEALQSHNDAVDDEGTKRKGKPEPVIPWIEIQGGAYVVPYITSFEKDEQYKDNRNWFCIVMNKGPLPTAHCNYEDTVFRYTSPELRDRAYENIRASLISTGRVKFL